MLHFFSKMLHFLSYFKKLYDKGTETTIKQEMCNKIASFLILRRFKSLSKNLFKEYVP